MKRETNIFKRYFIDGLSYMALGLFSSLIVGLIITQLSKIPGLSFLSGLTDVLAASSPVIGSAIGVAISYGLSAKPLVLFTSAATGAIGYVAGGPVGAYIAAIVGTEVGGLVASKTKIDIVVTPITTLFSGGFVGILVGPYISSFMLWLGSIINNATEMSPFPMGIIVAVVVGLALTAPISSAALCIMLDISGLAAGAATVGCCAQMLGFAVTSYRDNGLGGLISQGLGTSMLQISNILKRPAILIAPTLTAAVLGPLSTVVFKMTNTAAGAGMGTSGLVGQFGTFAAMSTEPFESVMLKVVIIQFVLPILIALSIDAVVRKLGWVKKGDMKLTVAK